MKHHPERLFWGIFLVGVALVAGTIDAIKNSPTADSDKESA